MTTAYRFVASAAAVSLCLLPVVVTACGGVDAPPPVSVRLVDLYDAAAVEGTNGATERAIPRTEWQFDTATLGWEAGPGVSDLAIRDGRLTGKSIADFPILRVERTSAVDERDLLHAVEIRLTASAGANLSVAFNDAETVDFEKVLDDAKTFSWSTTVPLIAGEEMRTYTLTSPRPVMASDIHHLLLRPTDAAGAGFAIESVRLVFRKEHLASVPSGIGWHGLSEIYRETLVSRSPEVIRFRLTLPERPWLDLGVGTIETGPVTFRVGVSRGRDADDTVLLEQTVTQPHRWEEAPIDLAPYAGEEVTLSLSLRAEEAGALGFWGSPAVRRLGGAAPPQGVIVIWADTLRRDHLDIYGYGRPTSPELRRMAREGALFGNALVNATWTKVSTPSLFTGLYPRSHGVTGFNDLLPASATTLAEVYRDAGYATLSLSSIVFTGKFTNLHQGFEQLHESSSVPDELDSKTARELVDRLLPWLDAHREVPFFVFLHVSDPHDPFLPYAPYDTLWADASWKEEHEANAERVRDAIRSPLLKRFGMPTRGELQDAGIDPDVYVARERDWYDGSIRAMDAEIGRLFERLRRLGLDRRTLVVFTSDHGEEFLEHGRMFHGQSVYGELADVPLVLWGPGVLPGGAAGGGLEIPDTVQSIDVMPTLLELSGLPIPEEVQGRSLVPLLVASGAAAAAGGLHAAEPAHAPRGPAVPAFIQKARTALTEPSPVPREIESFAIVYEGWKLVHNIHRLEGESLKLHGGTPRPEFELYETAQDRLELNDVALQHPEVVARLSKILVKWMAAAEAARLAPDSEGSEALSQDELERLRSLGYLN